ncbi:hypothetical protein O181_096821 [Austropuccinia psidii MF-1]|uniref:Uncharacterized protein n=1 Tax=Austropuccinia psidii MF-1 TaxID=1389203 RepID=A0A9Q3PEJ0_9BASI|nr:hypothetical protein [Austropuccinia psidii MF-1]
MINLTGSVRDSFHQFLGFLTPAWDVEEVPTSGKVEDRQNRWESSTADIGSIGNMVWDRMKKGDYGGEAASLLAFPVNGLVSDQLRSEVLSNTSIEGEATEGSEAQL